MGELNDMGADSIYKNERKIILFGAGKKGKEALKRYGKEKVAYFCDNDINKNGMKIDEVEVVDFKKLIEIYSNTYVIIITLAFPCFVIGQLESVGITDYLIYQDTNPHILNYKNGEDPDEKEHNSLLREYARKSQEFDLLEDIDKFSILVKDVLTMSREKGLSLNYRTKGHEEEGYRYGNLQTLERYAGLASKEGCYLPTVSHVYSIPIFSPVFEYKTAVIMSGEYYKRKIHERAPWVPVFTIGPYIKYAKEIYDTDLMKKKKKLLGSMLLAFLPHTLENTSRYYSRKKYLDEVLNNYGHMFDRIWLCVYFADINDEICEYAESRGVHVVTAGFRFDPYFNDRLKTIIQLSDGVVCGDIGGFLTYSISLNKPISRVGIDNNESLLDAQYENEIERNIEKTQDYLKFEKDFYHIFDENVKLDNKMQNWMDPVAGFSLYKNEEYIKRVFEISGDIWEESKGNYRLYPDAVRRMFYKYNEKNDYENMYILRQAVGNFLD